MPVEVPGGVQVDINGSNVHVKGPKGELKRTFSPLIGIKIDGNQITVERKSNNPAERALHGTTRAVLANMVHGVSTGFQVVLEVEGVGYRAEMNGKNLVLNVGYSHPVVMEPPEGISFEADVKTRQIKCWAMTRNRSGRLRQIFAKCALRTLSWQRYSLCR
jgi:large subunit ribosomal protein L6